MISEIVLFSLPEGLSREEAMAKYRARVSLWQSNPDLIHKAFLYDEGSRRGGDNWDEDYLGKVYDAEVVRRLFPYLKEYKLHAAISLAPRRLPAR